MSWEAVLNHFGRDMEKATEFIQRRRRENKGTSKSRNDMSETYLLFEDEVREWTTTTMDPLINLSAKISIITRLVMFRFQHPS